jgi:hypothetical protein
MSVNWVNYRAKTASPGSKTELESFERWRTFNQTNEQHERETKQSKKTDQEKDQEIKFRIYVVDKKLREVH